MPKDIQTAAPAAKGYLLTHWAPEDPVVLGAAGPAHRQAQPVDFHPRLLLAFAVWMVWSVVVVNLPQHRLQLHAPTSCSGWRPCRACPARPCGSSIRSWCRSSAAAAGPPSAPHRCCCRPSASASPCRTPTPLTAIMLILALLCGFGGGNFASSMANISFFYPKAQKGTALGLNAGLGNLGVSRRAVRGAAGHHRRGLRRPGRRAADLGQGRRDQADVAAERRLHLDAVHRRRRPWPPGSA